MSAVHGTSNVVSLPLPRPGRANPAPAVPLRRYRFADMVQLCELQDLSRRSQVDRLRALTRIDGLPAPLTHRLRGGRVLRGADAVCTSAHWDAAAVDFWHHRPGPAAPAGQLDLPPLPASARSAMAANAARLAGVA